MQNQTSLHQQLHTDIVYLSIRSVQKYLIPVICVLGSTGNILAILTFLGRTLRDKSCCIYLATKCVSDTLFLLSLFLVWLARVDMPVFHLHGFCQIIIFVTYICGFLSVWIVVLITLENYIRISHPARVSQLCSAEKAKYVILVLVTVSIFVYHFPLWTTGIISGNGTEGSCSSIEKYTDINQGLTYADTILTLVLPSVLIVVLMIAILCSVYEAYKRQERLRRLGRHGRRRFLSKSPHGRITKMLFAVSTVFIFFHTPSHAIRLRLLILQFLNENINPMEELKLQRIFELIYYSNFSTNCIIYVAFGKTFRDIFRHIFCKSKLCCFYKSKTSPEHPRYSIYTGLSAIDKTFKPALMNSIYKPEASHHKKEKELDSETTFKPVIHNGV